VVMDDFVYGEPISAVPEASTLMLLAAGLLGFGLIRLGTNVQLPSDPPRDGVLAVRLAVPVIKARRGLSPPSRQPATTAGLDSASNGATRHAWRTQKKRRPQPPPIDSTSWYYIGQIFQTTPVPGICTSEPLAVPTTCEFAPASRTTP
jgi:hypothetical protein